MEKRKIKYVYLVYANPEPIIYSVYSSKSAALKYAQFLINYRKERAEERGYKFDFYHKIEEDKGKRKEHDFEKSNEKLIFSACLQIKDELKDFSDDGCLVKVVRKPLLERFKK